MTLHHDIARAERQHAPRKHLRDELVKQTTAQIAFEDSAEHAVAMHLVALMGAIDGLCKIASENAQGYALAKQEITDIELSHNRLAFLVSALKARKAP